MIIVPGRYTMLKYKVTVSLAMLFTKLAPFVRKHLCYVIPYNNTRNIKLLDHTQYVLENNNNIR